ncbi:class I SAM-dependent methyltransferase [Streptomyces sp. FIT100]|uniref:class I SAM-dependent methyltransferase n=1 Tax=Streptomyces sp. FIT100 TaxID=2837956 RepID=UPI0021C7176E|nr:class I SAM-dependent methyltransferase [Streptomyces sp. FIT100]UUN27309.1 class I SAM-dependent methyltransferase [Streptomyces sp. FIT100]
MPSLLSNRLAKRVLRPAFTLVEQRLERATTALQSDLDALHHEVADLRRQSYGLGLLLDHAGRDGHRMPTATQLDTLVREVTTVTGASDAHARSELTVAYRTVVALEALGIGSMPGSTSDVCGKLATVPLLAPPNGDVLEIGTGHGLFASGLLRMLHRAGVEPRLTAVGPLTAADPLTGPVREDAVRVNLALCGGRSAAEARIAAPRNAVSDRRYGVVVIAGDPSVDAVLADLEWSAELAADGAAVIVDGHADDTRPGVNEALGKHLATGSRLRLLGQVAGTAVLRAA